MDYLMGILWARGQMYISSGKEPSRMILNINVRTNEKWKVDVLEVISDNSPISLTDICSHPNMGVYLQAQDRPLTQREITSFLITIHKQKADPPKITKIQDKWVVTNWNKLTEYINQLKYDMSNFNICQEMSRKLLNEIIKKQFKDTVRTYEPSYRFNITKIQHIIELEPFVLRYLIDNYGLPIGAQQGLIDIYLDTPEVPRKILEASREIKLQFLRGIADAIGTLEGTIVGGIERDARMKFDIVQGPGNVGAIKAVKLCHFIQDELNIPIQTLYIRTPEDARPHLVKVWAEDLRDVAPVWRIKLHYEQRLEKVLQHVSTKGIFCPKDQKNNIKPIAPFVRNPAKYKEIPTPLRCYNFCEKIRNYLKNKNISKTEVESAFKEQGKELPY